MRIFGFAIHLLEELMARHAEGFAAQKRDEGEEHKPSDEVLVEVADRDVTGGMDEESRSQRPDELEAGGPRAVDLAEADGSAHGFIGDGDGRDEKNHREQAAVGACQNVGVGNVEEMVVLVGPSLGGLCAEEPPVGKIGESAVDEDGAVIAGRALDDVNAREEIPDRRLHGELKGREPSHDGPTNLAHALANRPEHEGHDAETESKQRSAGSGREHDDEAGDDPQDYPSALLLKEEP